MGPLAKISRDQGLSLLNRLFRVKDPRLGSGNCEMRCCPDFFFLPCVYLQADMGCGQVQELEVDATTPRTADCGLRDKAKKPAPQSLDKIDNVTVTGRRVELLCSASVPSA